MIKSVIFTLLVAASSLIETPAQSAPGPFGLGIILAGPTGISANYDYDRKKSVDAALAWGNGDFLLHFDHLWYHSGLIVVDGTDIGIHAGLGLRFESRDLERSKDRTSLGLRFPVGLNHLFQKIPLQLFAELTPTLVLVDSSAFLIDIAVGGRYYF